MNLPEQLPLFQQLPPATPVPRLRHVLLCGRVVAYELRQGKRRRLAMHIDERGLRVGSPRAVPLAEIEEFIRSHGEWVIAKLDEFSSRRVLRQLAIRDGQRLPLLGGEVDVRVTSGANRFHWRDALLELAARDGGDLDELARRALKTRALAVFGERLAHYAERMGHAPPPLSLSSARGRWGSCSLVSGIRLNWRLIHLPLELVDYVVVHELAHLREMNHSPRFWAEVARGCPDWRALRAELKLRGAEIPII
ncbi:M48 family metallopeptidase [Denitratisoma sp. DHT3]|uniref:M48 family metallopeptidase n=1 Tax=Denitratisoma sp. DHT3 TaxID=1981880 RepID=UPI001C948879|nr:SprT family zinc-dependent metalloprotease [Denitratisoma sp. DHT3]